MDMHEKDDVLRLACPAYPLINILRNMACADVFLSSCFDGEQMIVQAPWRSDEPCRYIVSWRGRKDQRVFSEISSFVSRSKGKVVNFYELAYPGDLRVTGTAVEFTCPPE
jgi:hypothetical protein